MNLQRKLVNFISVLVLTLGLWTITASAASYTVQEGDTLGKIAKKNNTTVEAIAESNDIENVNLIYPGQVIVLGETFVNNDIMDLFDAEYYASEYPDVVEVYGTEKNELWKHFTEFGLAEGRSITPDFNVLAYRSAYPDLQTAFGTDLNLYYEHYLSFGQEEKRDKITIKAVTDAGMVVVNVKGEIIAAPAVKPAEVKPAPPAVEPVTGPIVWNDVWIKEAVRKISAYQVIGKDMSNWNYEDVNGVGLTRMNLLTSGHEIVSISALAGFTEIQTINFVSSTSNDQYDQFDVQDAAEVLIGMHTKYKLENVEFSYYDITDDFKNELLDAGLKVTVD